MGVVTQNTSKPSFPLNLLVRRPTNPGLEGEINPSIKISLDKNYVIVCPTCCWLKSRIRTKQGTHVRGCFFYIRRYSGFQTAVDTPEGKIFRFVCPVAKIFR